MNTTPRPISQTDATNAALLDTVHSLAAELNNPNVIRSTVTRRIDGQLVRITIEKG